ncbi:prenyltransferase [Chromatiaceae bacterium AAb-1]|nr:prenyltransferase [Chromatiaceae bacterium AAb-1]
MLKVLLGVSRPNFLTLTLCCIVLAATFSWYQTGAISSADFTLVMIIAMAAHISVNAFNEYFDFRSGLDFVTRKTPFSGGTGTLVANPGGSQAALALAVATLLIVIGGGLWLSYVQGWRLLLLGIPGVLLIYGYTQYVNRWAFICLLAPGIGFGLLMTAGAILVFSHSLSYSGWLLSAIICLLVSNLLLLNQFPDVEADRQFGRRHFPIILGRTRSSHIYFGFLTASYLLLILGISLNWLPPHTLLALLSLLPVPGLVAGIRRYAEQPDRLTPYLGMNVLHCHLYPLLLAAGLFWAGLSSPVQG